MRGLRIFAPTIKGTWKFPKSQHEWDQEEKHHDQAVCVEYLVVSVRVYEVSFSA